jgi:hypothetical protein
MARSSLLALCLALAACSTSITVPPDSTRTPRTPAPTPFDDSARLFADTARTFIAALNAGQLDPAYALIDEHFAFGGDCDYERRSIWSISDRESARNWLQVRIADHDRIDIVGFVDVPSGERVLGAEIERSSDSIRAAEHTPSVRPRVPLILHFSLDGRRIAGLAFAWSTLVGTFADCL